MAEATAPRQKARKDERRELAASFWKFSTSQDSLNESERLKRIHKGFSPKLFQALRVTFELQEKQLEVLLNASTSTLERRRRERKNLDQVASERLDRIATVSHLAEEVFEDREEAINWLSRPNEALGGQTPIMLCETEIGAKQVRRILHALEWGGVV